MKKIEGLLQAINRTFDFITSLNYVVNEKVNDTLYDQDIINYSGRDYIIEQLGDVRYKVGPKSFFQTNTKQAIRLFDTVVEFAELKGDENVYDLYTGLGSIALYIADKVKHVTGIEEVVAAIEDANENAIFNNIANTTFYAGDVKDILTADFSEKHGKPDLVISDPPRAGMHGEVCNTLLKLEAPRIVYVSCNPSSQARDLVLLSEKYDVDRIKPVDMFPHTHHIENVVLLVLRS
jgi:23S rRNA (uracil1939-C5)-methyltransferase